MSKWNFGDVWETVAEVQPDAPALVHGSHTRTWREFDQRADNVGRWLLGRRRRREDKVALYLYNCPEYLEASYAAYKCGLVPINTNYRYADDELVYLWENADAVAVVFHGVFVERIEGIRDRVPGVRSWLWVDDGTVTCPPWAVPYEEAAETTGSGAPADTSGCAPPWGRGPDDVHMLYTGGTTGMPKGVMWRQDDLFARLNGGGFRRYPAGGLDRRRSRRLGANGPASPCCRPARSCTAPVLHRHGVPERGRPDRPADRTPVRPDGSARHHRTGARNCTVIVGDAFARPLLAALDAEPGGGTCRAWWASSPRG